MLRRTSHNGIRLPKLESATRRRARSFPNAADLDSASDRENATPSAHHNHLPSIQQGSVQNKIRQRIPVTSKPIKRSHSLPQTPNSRSTRYTPLSRINSRLSLSEPPTSPDGKSQDNTVSQVLSMTRNTADSIVDMMRILHKRLHPDVKYDGAHTEDEVSDIQHADIGQNSHKSILKSMKHCIIESDDTDSGFHSPHHSVKIDQNKNIINFYDGFDNGQLVSQYSFSPEFNDAYAELVDTT